VRKCTAMLTITPPIIIPHLRCIFSINKFKVLGGNRLLLA
jgi:hypothetical protein